MTELNSIKIIFAFMTFMIVFFGLLLNTLEPYLPIFFVRSFRYGKFAVKGKDQGLIKVMEVPKSWFRHFYVFSSILTLITLYYMYGSYVFNLPVPFWLRFVVDILGSSSQNRETAGATLLATILLTIQCVRRLYDTQFVSVYGVRSRMNLTHYVVGFMHYFGAVFALLVEAPNFTLLTNKVYYFRYEDIKVKDYLATLVFLCASFIQFHSTIILANLRKKKGIVISNEHFKPEGGLFKYVSSPHLLAEIIMYISLAIIVWNNTTWKYVLVWVLSNQIETALLSHWWYKETFPKYPQERKAIFPFIL